MTYDVISILLHDSTGHILFIKAVSEMQLRRKILDFDAAKNSAFLSTCLLLPAISEIFIISYQGWPQMLIFKADLKRRYCWIYQRLHSNRELHCGLSSR
jgi:hypothetical protein